MKQVIEDILNNTILPEYEDLICGFEIKESQKEIIEKVLNTIVLPEYEHVICGFEVKENLKKHLYIYTQL